MSVPLRRRVRKACGMAAGAAVKTMAASMPRGASADAPAARASAELFLRGIGDRGAQSLVERDLEREVAEPAVAEEGHGLAGCEGSFAERPVGGPAGAAERRRIGGGETGGHAHQRGGGSEGIVAERALQGVAEVGLLGTEAFAAGGAPLAGAAGGAEEGDAGAVAGRPAGHAGADRFHAADAFVAERKRGERQLFQPGDEKIGVAQAAGFHAEQDFAGGGLGEVEGFDGDGAAGVGEDGGSGVGTAHGEEYSEIRGRQT